MATVPPEETFGVRNMTAPLREEILEMPEGEREVYVRRLKRMSSFDLQRENNIARNRTWTRDLGLMNASAFFGMKKKRDGDDNGGRKRKRKKGGEEDKWDSDDSDTGEEPSTPVKTRGRGKKATGDSAGGKTTSARVPAWVTKAKSTLDDVGETEMGSEWTAVKDLWWRLEESSRFSSKVGNHE
jgi:hypothetical protein